ncbi:GAF and ANTAR domain-containing protein [Pseudonocardia benzenivorans]|uniref:GAF and ANTAR domain-containing protein n=1 Tax=Pseudonocardia benzenivorans TaxID=228005 RepID=A0ABW3VIF1_9PSEU
MEGGDAVANGAGAHDWAHEFSMLAAALGKTATPEDALRLIVEAAGAMVPAADLVSVTIHLDDGTFETAVCTEPLAARLDELQYRLREGPCLLASSRAGLGVFASSDLGADTRLARWGPAAAHDGVHSALAVGLFAHEEPPRLGALNFLSRGRGGLDGADLDAAVVLAAHTAAVLDTRRAALAAERTNENLRAALRNRDVIGQAKGILMEREGITEEQAFEILRSVSQRMNVKLADIAGTVTQRRCEL